MGRRLAERAAVVWRRMRRRKRLVSGWPTSERGERTGAEPAERRVGEEEWIWPCWPPLRHCHEHCGKKKR